MTSLHGALAQATRHNSVPGFLQWRWKKREIALGWDPAAHRWVTGHRALWWKCIHTAFSKFVALDHSATAESRVECTVPQSPLSTKGSSLAFEVFSLTILSLFGNITLFISEKIKELASCWHKRRQPTKILSSPSYEVLYNPNTLASLLQAKQPPEKGSLLHLF